MRLVTPRQVSGFLDAQLHNFDTPSAFLGDEPNTYSWTQKQWEDASFRTVLMAPFDYLQAQGNSTIPLLYQISNRAGAPGRVTERCYFPTSRGEITLFDKFGIPPWGLETRHSIASYDLIAIPLNYAPYFVNAIKMLRMADIPVRAKDRLGLKESYPLIMVGGHVFSNPWATSPVVDLVFAGEAESETMTDALAAAPGFDDKVAGTKMPHSFQDNPGFLEVIAELEQYKSNGLYYTAEGREQMLHELSVKYHFLFVPRFYTLRHEKGADGYWRVTGWDKKYADLPDRPQKRFVRNLDAAPALVAPPVPYYDPGLGAGTVQAARGCSYHCSFCAASYREAPYRERSEQVMLDSFTANLNNTGGTTASPLTLEFGTYSRKKSLMKRLLEEVTPDISMPALRVDVFAADPMFGQISVHGQKHTMTIAAEGSSQKMREIVSKGIREEDIIRSFANAITAGYDKVKVYMICNLPGEDADDYEEMYQTCLKIDELRRSVDSHIQVRLSWKPLTIQANTPLQWFPARLRSPSMADVLRKIRAIGFGTQIGDESKSGLGNFIQVAELADDIAGEALVQTAIDGDFVTFGALPNSAYDLLLKNLAAYGRTLDDYYRPKDLDEVFAWDIIDTLVTKAYLLRHHKTIVRRADDDPKQVIYGQGFLEKFGGCQIGCTQCGACDTDMMVTMKNFAARTDEVVRIQDIKLIDRTSISQQYTLICTIDPTYRFVSPIHWEHQLRRAANFAGLQVSTTGVQMLVEHQAVIKPWYAGKQYVDFCLRVGVKDWKAIPDSLNPNLKGFHIERILQARRDLGVNKRTLQAILWELEIDQDVYALAKSCNAVNHATNVPMVTHFYKMPFYHSGATNETVNLVDVMYDCRVVLDGRSAKMRMTLDPKISPYEAATAIVGSRRDTTRYAATAIDFFSVVNSRQHDAFTPLCVECGDPIPLTILGEAFHADYCHRCLDLERQVVV